MNCLVRVCDVASQAQVEATVKGTLERFGRVDVIVNNAGLMEFNPLKALTGEAWLRILSVDLLGTFYFIKQGFLHTKPGSSIVNVASIHAVETQPGVPVCRCESGCPVADTLVGSGG